MCGLLCMYNYHDNLDDKEVIFNKMLSLLEHRGYDDKRVNSESNVLLGHCRLAIIDVSSGYQPLEYIYQGIKYTLVFNGEIYNMNELKEELINLGYSFKTQCDSEVLLVSFIAYREECLNRLDGIFSFVISYEDKLFVARDQLGVKPLFYLKQDNYFVFASEIKSLLMFKQKAVVDENGLRELIGLGPSNTPSRTVYKDIYSIRPAHYMYIDKGFYEIKRYWSVAYQPYNKSYLEAVHDVRCLVNHSVHNQLISDVGISCMLSGGLDSSIITAISSQYLNSLSTYSVDYQDQDKYFKPYSYQTSQDKDFIDEVIDMYHTKHQNVVLSQKNLIMYLKEALIGRDQPGMADIDSSFYLFCKDIARNHKVVLSGECADEIFGGYPWFYKKELYESKTFPWIRDIDIRLNLVNDNLKHLNIKEYVDDKYNQTLQEIDYYDNSFQDTNKRKMLYLNIEWFMQTLLTRSDSQSMMNTLELRVPFANKDIVSYMYNVPWAYMYHDNNEKGLLRDAFKDLLPKNVYTRKKNPYPKTHSPFYLTFIKSLLKESLNDKSNILYQIFDINKLNDLIENIDIIKAPWFGQLMTGPQLLAYFYQIYLWGKLYHIEIELN